ncbi:MAG: O-antigen ligase family protein, partial [Gammaproteobacteria bacterium]
MLDAPPDTHEQIHAVTPSRTSPSPGPSGSPETSEERGAKGLFRGQDISLSAIRIGVLVYVAVMFLPHTGFVRTLSLYIPFLFWIWRQATQRGESLTILRQPIMLMFIAWVLVLLPSALYAPDMGYALTTYHKTALRALILALLVVEGFNDPRWFRRLLLWLSLMAIGLVGLFVYAIILNVDKAGGLNMVESSGQFRVFGDALVIILPLVYLHARAIRSRWRWLFWVTALLLVALAVVTGSRAVFTAAVCGLVFLVILDRHRAALVTMATGMALGMLVFVFTFQQRVLDERFDAGLYDTVRMEQIWKPSVGILMDQAPWLGFGYGPAHFNARYDETMRNTPGMERREGRYGLHNQLLEIAVQ